MNLGNKGGKRVKCQKRKRTVGSHLGLYSKGGKKEWGGEGG